MDNLLERRWTFTGGTVRGAKYMRPDLEEMENGSFVSILDALDSGTGTTLIRFERYMKLSADGIYSSGESMSRYFEASKMLHGFACKSAEAIVTKLKMDNSLIALSIGYERYVEYFDRLIAAIHQKVRELSTNSPYMHSSGNDSNASYLIGYATDSCAAWTAYTNGTAQDEVALHVFTAVKAALGSEALAGAKRVVAEVCSANAMLLAIGRPSSQVVELDYDLYRRVERNHQSVRPELEEELVSMAAAEIAGIAFIEENLGRPVE
jgi:hypothetical protein